jgi:hypothetical protein
MRNGRGVPVLLRQIRVLNWHSIYDRTVDVPDTGLLIFGTNGSGKTSLQDALQLALFPDLNSIRFNTAVAHTNRDRNLLGYVLQRIEDDPQGRPVYAHDERTTYVAIAFERGRERMNFIVGIEGHRSDMSHERVLASLPGMVDLRDMPFMDEARMPAPIRAFEKWIRARGGHIYDKVSGYIGDVSSFNGSPSKDWPQLLKSSIGFKEIGDATVFVRRFLGEHAIDHKTLLQTFQSYEDLRATAQRTEGWIDLLADAVGPQVGEGGRRLPLEQLPSLYKYRHYRDRAMMYRVGEAQLPVMLLELEIKKMEDTLAEGERQRDEALGRQQALDSQLETARVNYRVLEEELRGRGVLSAIESIENDIKNAGADVVASEQAGVRVEQYRRALAPLYPMIIGQEMQIAKRDALVTGELELLGKDGKHRLVDFSEGTGDVHLHSAEKLNRMVDAAEQEISNAMFRIEGQDRDLRTRQSDLEQERAQLHRGRIRYPYGIEAARNLFRERLGWTDARPLAEMLEIAGTDEEWREAVEAELGWARYYFVVPPELYQAAQSLYERYREKGYTGESGRPEKLHNVSIVDVGKLRERRMNRVERGSLAEKVQADGPDAEDYVNFAIGRVACVTDSRRLREHDRAVTRDLLFYHGFRLSSYNRANLDLCIGQAARARRLARVESELTKLAEELDTLRRVAGTLASVRNILRAATQGFQRFRDDIQAYRLLGDRKKRKAELEQNLNLLRNSEHRERLERRDALRLDVERLERELIEASGAVDGTKRQISALKTELLRQGDKVAGLEENADAMLADTDFEIRQKGFEAFEQELTSRAAAAGGLSEQVLVDFRRTCGRQTNENNTEANKAREQFTSVATRYRQETSFVPNATVEHPDTLIAERERLVETALPEQRKKLETKAREMREGVVQNVLHSLGARFADMRRLIEEINRSTTGVETRLGHFKLVPKVKTENASIHALVERALTVLNFEQLDPSSDFYQDVESFMKRLIEEPTKRDDYCDYRSYFDFEVHNRSVDGTEYTPFRGTTAGGSGGERQVPFYVMTLALMDYLYQRGVRANQYVGRLLLMDEVFHNMSDDNVDDVMTLARQLGLQIVMVTPGKLRTLAPRFGKTVQVAKRVISPREPTRFTEYTIDNLPADLLDFAEYGEEQHAVA